jgi:hypothetical protein
MLRKKKSAPRDYAKPGKKVPLITVPSLNIPEGVELKAGRSVELRRAVGVATGAAVANPYRKAVSRKSTCKSAKTGGPARVAELSTIMQTFKELKLMHEQSRSKSRSPASCKSRSSKKHPLFPHKRKAYATLGTNPNSEVNLTLKLERTIKQLNQTDFFRDEDSLLPMQSASDLLGDDLPPQRLSSRNEEDIDLVELRNFCSTVKLLRPSGGHLSRNNYDAFKESRAALKIQRAWRRYQTGRLVDRYVFLSRQQEEEAREGLASTREHAREAEGLPSSE